MRNKFPGKCYNCGKEVKVGEGFFQRIKGGWKIKHATGTLEEIKRCNKHGLPRNTHIQNS